METQRPAPLPPTGRWRQQSEEEKEEAPAAPAPCPRSPSERPLTPDHKFIKKQPKECLEPRNSKRSTRKRAWSLETYKESAGRVLGA